MRSTRPLRPSRQTAAAVIAMALAFCSPHSLGFAESVREFGAVGDGVADDTEAIERALTETETGQLQFPRGDYRITETVEVDLKQLGRISLDGLGGTGRVTMDGPGPAFRFTGTHQATANPSGFSEETWQHERMPQIRGLEILGAHPEAD